MFTVVITEKGGAQKRLSFEEPEVTIGRVPGNDVVLPKGNVSKRHSRIVLKDNRFIVVDLKSTNGTYVNGRKITSPLVVKEGDKIYIGDFILTLEGDAAMQAPSSAMRPPSMLPNNEEPATGEHLDNREARAVAQISSASAPPLLPSRAPEGLGDDLPAVLRSSTAPKARPALSSEVEPSAHTAPSLPPVLGVDGSDEAPNLDLTGALSQQVEPTNVVPYQSAEEKREAALEDSPAQGDSEPPSVKPPAKPARRSLPPVLGVMQEGALPEDLQKDVRALMQRLSTDLDTDNADPHALADEKRWQKAERVIQNKVHELTNEGTLGRSVDRNMLVQAALHEAVGLGVIDTLLADTDVFHIVIERFDRVRADRGKGLVPEEIAFSSPQALLTAVRRLAAHAGVAADSATLDINLVQGLHVVALLPKCASDGPVASIRRRPKTATTLDDLQRDDAVNAEQIRTIVDALASRRNVLVVGPSTSGLATFASALLESRPKDARFVLVESTPEIALGERSAICLRRGDAQLGDLLKSARHFRAHQLMLHDLERVELETALTAFANGAHSSIATMVSTNAHDALTEIADAVRSQGPRGLDTVRRALGLVVSIAEEPNGGPRITAVCDVIVDGGVLKLEEAS